MRHDVRDALDPIQAELFANQGEFEEKVLGIGNEKKRRRELTRYTIEQGDRVVNKAWELGDLLWTKYDEKF
jgi:dipeptidase